jgi:hypothetical protein
MAFLLKTIFKYTCSGKTNGARVHVHQKLVSGKAQSKPIVISHRLFKQEQGS